MKRNLDKVLTKIGEEYEENVSGDSRFYLEVDIGKAGEKLGYPEVKEKYNRVNAVVPLKEPVNGMKVLIDGRTYVDYAQFDSGIVVPGYVARDSGLPHKAYTANDSMILVFA